MVNLQSGTTHNKLTYSSLFKKSNTVEITKVGIAVCRLFATKVTNCYSDSNQHNTEFKKEQHFYGKLGELAVSTFYSTKQPDFRIYSNTEKSWDKDLKSENGDFSIKTQTLESAHSWGLSWIFQKIAGGRTDSMFKGDVEFDVVCTLLNVPKAEVAIIARIPAKQVLDLLETPKKSTLIDSKRALYFEKIPKEFLV